MTPPSKVKLTIGVAVAGVPIVIPMAFTLRLYANDLNFSVAATDRFQGSWPAGTLPTGPILGMPYWNGSAEQTANGQFYLPFVDFDGRTFATVTPNQACPFAFILTDPTAPAPTVGESK